MTDPDRAFLTQLFEAAVQAADPVQAIRTHLPQPPKGRTVVVGAGKGAAQLAAAFEALWPWDLSGVVVTRYGFGVPCQRIKVLEAAHPVPDEAGLLAAQSLFQAVEGLSPDDLVVALICGGGSALLPCPLAPLTLADEIALNRSLLASGAPIRVMNAVRKQISGIKGGRLAKAAHPARVVSLVVSDVPGDDPAQVASGPTVPDGVTRADARALVAEFGIELPASVVAFLAEDEGLAPLPSDPNFAENEVFVIASAGQSLAAAAALAVQGGVTAVCLSDALEGEAREVGQDHAGLIWQVLAGDVPYPRPVVILSGGETTVTLRGEGKGGRNSEYLLALALAAEGAEFAALAADTDGIDGSEDNAGAFADGVSVGRLRAVGLEGSMLLDRNDAWTAFDALGDLFVPGPTGTNVNDFRALLIR